MHVPAARIWHKIPLDARADQPYVAYYIIRNRLLFLHATGATALAWLHAMVLQDLGACVSLNPAEMAGEAAAPRCDGPRVGRLCAEAFWEM